jgi:hypothetical protein
MLTRTPVPTPFLLARTAGGRHRHAHMAEYVCVIVRACLKIFRLEKENTVRADSIATLLAALELKEHVPDLKELRACLFPPRAECDPVRRPSAVQQYWGHLSSAALSTTTETVRGGCLRLLGRLAVLFPVSVSDEPVYEKFLLYRACERSLSTNGVGQPEVQGAIEALDALLFVGCSPLSAEHVRHAFDFALARLSLVGGSNGEETIKRFGTPKAALGLIGHNLELFAATPGCVLALDGTGAAGEEGGGSAGDGAGGGGGGGGGGDGGAERARLRRSLVLSRAADLWQAAQPLWTHRNAELSALTDEVLQLVCAKVAEQIAEAAACSSGEGDDAAELRSTSSTLHRFFDSRVRVLVSEAIKASTSRAPDALERMATAVRLLSTFARPVACISGVAAISQHLDELCDYAAAYLLPVPSQHRSGGSGRQGFGFESAIRQLPAFLVSFSDLIAPLDAVPERCLTTLHSLVLLLFSRINQQPENVLRSFTPAASDAVITLLATLHSKGGDALPSLLRRLVPAAALVTVDAAASEAARAQAAGVAHAHAFFGGLGAQRLWVLLTDAHQRPPSKLAKAHGGRRRGSMPTASHGGGVGSGPGWQLDADGDDPMGVLAGGGVAPDGSEGAAAPSRRP